MTARQLPPLTYLNECFTYDPERGTLFWKERPPSHFSTNRGWGIFNGRFAATSAGHRHHHIDGRKHAILVQVSPYGKYCAHRIIYAIMGVSITDWMEIDHRDCDPFNNRWNNMRLATRAQNAQNQPKIRFTKHPNIPKGVFPIGSKFKAQIKTSGQQIHLGYFDTIEGAHAAYCAKATELFGDYARFN